MSLTLFFDPPGPEAKALAEKELRETEENVRKGLETLKKYLEGWQIYHFSQFNPEEYVTLIRKFLFQTYEIFLRFFIVKIFSFFGHT